jgi:DNA primase
VFITEGTIDSILLTQEGIPAVAQTAGAVYWSPYWYPYFSNVKDIYYITDNDEAGRRAAARVAMALGQDRVHIYQFEGKKEKFDTVDFFREGGTAKDFKELVKSGSKYLFETGELNEYSVGHRRRSVSVAR